MADITPEERARKAIWDTAPPADVGRTPSPKYIGWTYEQCLEAIRAAVQAEREACAKIAEDYANSRKGDGIETQRAIAADQIAAAIRARADARDIHEERMDAYQFGKVD